MKIANFLRSLIATCTLTIAHANAAPVLLLDNDGVLTGAKNVEIAGNHYDVKFAVGSCNSLFNNCDPSAFTFNTEATARQAAQALLDQVFIDGQAGQFDSVTTSILGCTHQVACIPYIPFAIWSLDASQFVSMDVFNFSAGRGTDFVDIEPLPKWLDTARFDYVNFALFTPAAPASSEVPEPGSMALFTLAMAGLAFARRRKA